MISIILSLFLVALGIVTIISLFLYFSPTDYADCYDDPRLMLPADPKDAADLIKMQMGYVKGGMYSGITFIPGDPDKPWEEGKDNGECPACGGKLRTLYQISDEIVDEENRKYYKSQCKDCNYLDDVGMVMTAKEQRRMQHVYCKKVEAITFNRNGSRCCYIWASYGYTDVVSKIEPCDECPHPY
jgi:hypothetical protein